jgi:pimeloyl-ACP methyl ester carboxylesterase
VAEAELERDVRASLLKILHGASGDGTQSPFGMVSRTDGMLAPLPVPSSLPPWLTQADLDEYMAAFRASGFGGGLSYLRNLDRNWELQASLRGMRIEVPALYLAGERDPGLAMPGMRQIIDAMPQLVPGLAGSHVIEGGGHWIPQEKPDEVNALLIAFLRSLPN